MPEQGEQPREQGEQLRAAERHRAAGRTTWSPSRRDTLRAGLVGAVAVGASSLRVPRAEAQARRGGPVGAPFTLGVASGEPLPDGVVLWTRLAPEPLALDGLGGMPSRPVPVQWQVATDEAFHRVVARGTELAQPEEAHSVHVEVGGLQAGADYFYRFKAGTELSPVGRTRTAPALGQRLDRFSFAFASCQNYPAGYYTAYTHMAQDDLDLVVFLGDYIYTGAGQGTIGRGWVPAEEVETLEGYRVRLAQVKTDPELQAAHAAFPWVVTFDDHEVANGWAADDVDPNVPAEQFRARRAAAFQAYYENMPVRRAQRPDGSALRIHRRVTFGDLIDFYVLDTRQYRSDQVPQARRGEPGRTMLGAEQEAWLQQLLAGPTARWNTLAQQVVFSQRDFMAGPEQGLNGDSWDNYLLARNRLRDHMSAVGTSNPVVLTGDVHQNYAIDVKADFDDPGSATVATELVGTSISSNGDASPNPAGDARQLAENPHIRFTNRDRGYVRNTVTPRAWTTDFRAVEYVSRPGAPARTLASFVIEDGRPGVVPA